MAKEILYSDTTVVLILAIITFAAIWLDANTSFFKKIGAAALVILMGMTLSNSGILPPESSVYSFFSSTGVLAGIILILLKIDIGTIKKAGLPMIKAFGIGAVGSSLGALAMGYWLFPDIGEETWKLSGQFAATYIGGGMNYAAMGAEFETSSDLFSAGIAADVIITAIWLIVCITIPSIFESFGSDNKKKSSDKNPLEKGESSGLDVLLFKSATPISLGDFSILLVIVVGVIWISQLLAALVPYMPMIIWLTTFVLILAQFKRIKKISGSMVLGNFMIMLFLATNGARSLISRIVEIGPSIFYFALGTVAIHGIVIFGVGRLMRIDSSILSIASQANVGGSASAMAIAGARGYTSLILSGVAVGMLGNAVGNYIGLLVAFMVKALVL